MNIFAWIFRKKRTERWIAELTKSHGELMKSKIVLDDFERKMLLDALTCDEYEGKMFEPKVKAFIRAIYKNLKIKIGEGIRE